MTKPTIHLNGSSGESLLEGYRTAMEAVRDAQEAVQEAAPNARDYYPQQNSAWEAAIREHTERLQKLESVYLELTELAVHCYDIITERDARRAERSKSA